MLLQGRLIRLGLVEQVGDAAHLRAHAGGGHHHLTATPGYARIHVGHIVAITQGHFVLVNGVRLFGRSNAFAGQGGLLDLEGGRHEEASIGRHAVAGLHQHHVARHQPLGFDLDGLAVTAHARDILHHLLQRGQAGLSLGFATHAQDGVEDRQQHEDNGRTPLAREDQAERGSGQQDDLHKIFVLTQESLQARFLLFGGQFIGAILRKALLRLCTTQPFGRIDLQLFCHFVHRHGIPVGLTLSRRCHDLLSP